MTECARCTGDAFSGFLPCDDYPACVVVEHDEPEAEMKTALDAAGDAVYLRFLSATQPPRRRTWMRAAWLGEHRAEPCDRVHVVPDGEACPDPAHRPVVLEGGEMWSAVLYQPGTGQWRLVGTTGDREHALAEAQDWKDGLFEAERVSIARQMRGPWVVVE